MQNYKSNSKENYMDIIFDLGVRKEVQFLFGGAQMGTFLIWGMQVSKGWEPLVWCLFPILFHTLYLEFKSLTVDPNVICNIPKKNKD